MVKVGDSRPGCGEVDPFAKAPRHIMIMIEYGDHVMSCHLSSSNIIDSGQQRGTEFVAKASDKERSRVLK